MASHQWGDESFDWDSLNQAINYMTAYMKRWGRLGTHSKEKYGTARLYMWWYSGGLFSLFYPAYVSYWPWADKKYIGKYLMWLEYNVFQKFTSITRLPVLIHWWQMKVYTRAYENALKKWPGVAAEIVCCADNNELIPSWHKVMYEHARKETDETTKRWLKTADFYRRLLKEIAEFDDEGHMTCLKDPGPSFVDIAKINNEYEEFDRY